MNLLDFYQFTVITNKKQTRQVCRIKKWYSLLNTIPNNFKIFFCLEIMLLFILISSFNNIKWHCLYVLECLKLLFSCLKLRNLGVNPSWWQLCKNCKLASFFQILKSSFSNLRNHLTASECYILWTISATDLFAGNLSSSKSKNTSAKILTIIFAMTHLMLKAALLWWK